MLIPIAAALAVLVDFAVSLLCMVALLIWYGVSPGWAVGLLPVAVLLTLILALGVSFWVSALNVRYRDFMYALPFFLQLWMYASPVVYSLELIPPRWQLWFAFNPMVGIIDTFRAALLGEEAANLNTVGVSGIAAAVMLVTGAYFFRRVERRMADWV
jgi:lipopolysaccharide transport system permease protein